MANKKRNTKLYVLIVLLLITIGFALLSTTLKIDGLINIDKNTWNIHFENVEITEGSVEATTVPTSDNETTKEMQYAVLLKEPGDFYEFTVDIANDGSVDGMINLVDNKVYETDGTTEKEIPSYLRSTITYIDGIEIKKKQLIPHGTSEKIKVRVEFRTDISESDLPTEAEDTIFKFVGNFTQATDEAIPIRFDFSTASWDDITTAYQNNPQDLEQAMENGTTKEVQLDLDNDGTAETTAHLRIANLSTPSECGTEGFSQTACGLVLEFADIITTHRMNPYDNSANSNGDGSRGGWEYSDMRAYLNSTTYAYENIDYSTSGIYNALPSELRDKIIDTTVVSGYGRKDSTNFTTTDKLYLLSLHEVWDDVDGNANGGIDYYDKSYTNTRQLDYYKAKGVTTSAYSEAIKNILSGTNFIWWLRSADPNYGNTFFTVGYNGYWGSYGSNNTGGVSPAFRIA